VSRGIMLAASGFATLCWAQSQAISGASKALLTGGDAAAIAPYLTFPFEIRPDLVLDGLAIALP
jgi:pantothenate kinase type III